MTETLVIGEVCAIIATVIAIGKAGEACHRAGEARMSASNAILSILMAALVLTAMICLSRALYLKDGSGNYGIDRVVPAERQ